MTASLRLARPEDAAAIASVYAPYVSHSIISFETEPPDAAQMGQRLQSVLARWPWLVAVEHGHVLGYAYAGEHRSRSAYRWDVDVAVYLDPLAQRHGLGRRLYRALFALLRGQGYVNAYAGIALPNPASVGLHEAMGFEPVGVYRQVGYKQGAWHDVGWWALTLQPAPAVPSEPLALPQLDAVVVTTILAAG